MRSIALFGLVLLLPGCVAPAGNSLYRVALPPEPVAVAPPQAAPGRTTVTPPAIGYGAAPPRVPAGGLGAEAPMPAPKASRIPAIGQQSAPANSAATTGSSGAGQSIVVPNGNGTSTIIHPDGTVETVPTPK